MKTAMILALALVGANASFAADGEPALSRAAIGPWRLSEIGGKIGCTVALIDRASLGGGRDVLAPGACQRAFPPLKDLSVWSFDERGGLVLSDPEHRHVVAFAGPLGGPYAATAPDGRIWRLDATPPRPFGDRKS
jgi:hypothetical protein